MKLSIDDEIDARSRIAAFFVGCCGVLIIEIVLLIGIIAIWVTKPEPRETSSNTKNLQGMQSR